MGYEANFYIGPAIHLKKDIVMNTEKESKGCVNASCSLYHKESYSPFCSNCGHENNLFLKTEKRKLYLYEIMHMGDIDEDAFSSYSFPENYFLPNNTKYSLVSMHKDSDPKPFTCENTKNILTSFLAGEETKKILAVLDEIIPDGYSVDIYSLITYS